MTLIVDSTVKKLIQLYSTLVQLYLVPLVQCIPLLLKNEQLSALFLQTLREHSDSPEFLFFCQQINIEGLSSVSFVYPANNSYSRVGSCLFMHRAIRHLPPVTDSPKLIYF